MRTVADKVMLAACKGRTRSKMMTTLMQGMRQKLAKISSVLAEGPGWWQFWRSNGFEAWKEEDGTEVFQMFELKRMTWVDTGQQHPENSAESRLHFTPNPIWTHLQHLHQDPGTLFLPLVFVSYYYLGPIFSDNWFICLSFCTNINVVIDTTSELEKTTEFWDLPQNE